VRRSLTAIFLDASKRGLRVLAAEPLGAWQENGLGFNEVVDAFDAAVIESSKTVDGQFRLTLLLDDMEELEEVSHLLRSRVLSRASRSFRTVSGDAAVVEVRSRGERYHFRFVPGTLSGYLVTRMDSGS
jgi:hypothetical protein